MTLKTGVMVLKIQLYHHINKLHFHKCSITVISVFFVKLILISETLKVFSDTKLFNSKSFT